MESEFGQQSMEFSELVRRATEESFLAFRDLVNRSMSIDQLDSDKKVDILKFILQTRQRMLRLHVLAKWCHQVPLVQYCQQLSSTLSSHDICFTQTADTLFFMHEGMPQACAPPYDIPSAIEILLKGNYERLPKCIENLGFNGTLYEKQQKPTIRMLDTILRSKLLEVTMPKEISEIKVSSGTVHLQVDGEFKVLLTLGYCGHLSLWRILHLELLLGEKNGHMKLDDTRSYILRDDLERRMSAAENPFTILYSTLHELSVTLIMDTMIRQVQVLQLGRWKDAIRFELILVSGSGLGGNAGNLQHSQDGESDSNNLKTPGVKISYWLDSDRKNGGMDHSSRSFLKIDPGSDLFIQCQHSTFVLDPFSDKEAKFSLVQSCIDVEKLLHKAIACNKHTRLLDIQRELCKTAQFFENTNDVILRHQADQPEVKFKKHKNCNSDIECWGDETLQVRAYGSTYIILGINLRSGCFILQCSQNIIEPSVLAYCEESLNQGSMTALEVFIRLRNKSILNLFATMASFFGLEVYEQGLTTLKIPKFILNGTDLLLMSFPHCGSSHVLMIQLDSDFKPLFKLLKTDVDTEVGSSSAGESNQIVGFNDIDITLMELAEDEMDLSLLNLDNITFDLPNDGNSIQSFEHGLSQSFAQEHSLHHMESPQSSFSGIVDEVFVFEKGGTSAPLLAIQNKLSNSSSHPYISSVCGVKMGPPTKLEGALPYSQGTISQNASGVHATNSSLYEGLHRSGGFASLIPLRRLTPAQNLARSKSYQDFSVVKTTHLGETGYSVTKDDQERFINESSKVSGNTIIRSQSSQIISSSQIQGSVVNTKQGKIPDSIVSQENNNIRKHTSSDIRPLISSVQETSYGMHKRQRISSHGYLSRTNMTNRPAYGSLPADAGCQLTPNIYLKSLIHVVRRCSLCIKHARLTSQMDALEIPYVEEVGLRSPSSNLWFRLPFIRDDSWQSICLHLGKPGTMSWDVKVNDHYFKELWELKKGTKCTPWGDGVHIANTFDIDSHIHYDHEGIVLSYCTVESDSIKNLVSDLQRLFNARLFAYGMRNLLALTKSPNITPLQDGTLNIDAKMKTLMKESGNSRDKMLEQIQRVFKIEAVGLMSLWFCYGPIPVIAHFVVEWESGKEGCTMHVSPDQLWPHTKFLEEFINGGEVVLFLDCVRLTAGPLLSLGSAIRPARVPPVPFALTPAIKQNGPLQSQGILPNASLSNAIQSASSVLLSSIVGPFSNHSFQSAAMLPAAVTRGGPGIVPSSLLPIDVSVVLRGPYWIRIIYRKKFSVDMRCYAGDQVWLQPATPPKIGPSAGGSLPCPQFRPFIMEHVAQGLNAFETSFPGNVHSGGQGSNNINPSSGAMQVVPSGNKSNIMANVEASKPTSLTGTQGAGGLSRVGAPVHMKGEMNTGYIGLGDDGGYGGGWVPLAALKKVLRGILKYLGVLWLFAELPDLLKDILGSILNNNEGTLLNLDQEQPTLRFFVGGYVFAVSVHRVQLLLQVLSVKRFHYQKQHTQSNTLEELASMDISDICDYFSRHVASEPYDASRVASFITLLTLPISILREFVKLIAWEKILSQAQGDITPSQHVRVELCLENHSVEESNINQGKETDKSIHQGEKTREAKSNIFREEKTEKKSHVAKSNIHHDRAHSAVDFALTFVLDSALIPHANPAGGAAWLPYCVFIKLRYYFGENAHISLISIDGSHGGKACWSRLKDWDDCKQSLARAIDFVRGNSTTDFSQGRIKMVAQNLQRKLQKSLQQLKDTSVSS